MVVLGARLLQLGGSPYYLVAGLVFTLAAVQLYRERASGYWLFVAALAATIIWAFAESGPHWLVLLPRLDVFVTIIAVYWLCWRWIGPRLLPGAAGRRLWLPVAVPAVALLALAGLSAVAFRGAGQVPLVPDVVRAAVEPAADVVPLAAPGVPDGDWPNYGRTPGGNRFSPLDQITGTNVAGLKRAWVYHTGATPRPIDTEGGREFMFEATPIVVRDRLVLCTPHAEVIALDPARGHEIWRFDPKANTGADPFLACRGVAYDETAGASGLCAHRILYATLTARLYALDLETGARCPKFGTNGEVDLTVGLGQVDPGFYFVTSPPAIVRGKAVLGGWIFDNVTRGEPSGVVRAFDTATGQLAWAYDMGRPDRTGLPPPGDQYTRQTPNVWAPISADPTLGLVYLPTGNQTPDFFGGGRLPSSETFASSLIAVDADTGQMRWHFQSVHHDVWDSDIAAEPVLVDIPEKAGAKPTPAVLLATKRGEIFLFDRRDGHSLTAITERPVPQGAVPGDALSPTQPYPDFPSLRPPRLTEARMWGATPLDQLTCRIKFREHRYDGEFTPPSLKGSILYPSSIGVYEWSGVTVDPRRAVMYANTSWVAIVNRLVPRPKGSGGSLEHVTGDIGGPMLGTPYAAEAFAFTSSLGIPCQQPPWGHVTAIDLITRKVLWRDILGAARGGVGPPLKMGLPNLGGSVVTAGGLIFVGATADKTFRALDARTGKILWEDYLPSGGQATPSVYRAANGKEYVVIAAGGHASLSSTLGDAVVAYALP